MMDLEEDISLYQTQIMGSFSAKTGHFFYDLFTKHLGGGFKYFFIFTPTWGRFPFLRIFFKWVGSTTNQKIIPTFLDPTTSRKAKTAFLQCFVGSFYPSAQVVEAGRDQ